MDKTRDLITNSLEYYDRNREKYSKLFSKIKYYSYEYSDSDLEHNKIIFYDKHKNLIFTSRYEIIGIFNNYSNTWAWAWSIPYLGKNTIITSKKILNYALDIEPNDDNQFIKTELITSRLRISNLTQIDLHVAIVSYISKNPLIFKIGIHPIMASNYQFGDIIKIEKKVFDFPNYQLYFFFLLDLPT